MPKADIVQDEIEEKTSMDDKINSMKIGIRTITLTRCFWKGILTRKQGEVLTKVI